MNPYDPIIFHRPPGRIERLAPMTIHGATIVSATAIPSPRFPKSKEQACAQKLRDWGFDPNNVSKSSRGWYYSEMNHNAIGYGERASYPFIIFAQLGDLEMLQYIWDCTREDQKADLLFQSDDFGLFPLYTAISEPHTQAHVITVCQWLVEQGACVQQTVSGEWRPLSRACLKGMDRVAIWLISCGALMVNGRFSTRLARQDLPRRGDYGTGVRGLTATAETVHHKLFAWARAIVSTRQAFLLVLSAVHTKTFPIFKTSNGGQFRTAPTFAAGACSPLRMLNGQSGILQHIGGFVGVAVNRTILLSAKGLVNHYETWWQVVGPEEQ